MDAPDRPFTSRTSNMIVYQNFEWDFREAAENLAIYGVPFREAATVFTAEDVAITEDVASHQLFARGSSWRGRVLVVQHTRGVRIRILRAMVQQGEAAGRFEGVTEQGAKAEAKDAVAIAPEHIALVVTAEAPKPDVSRIADLQQRK